MSNFFARAAALEKPELRKRPFAVLDAQTPKEFAFAANKAARTRGVKVCLAFRRRLAAVTMLRRDVAGENDSI